MSNWFKVYGFADVQDKLIVGAYPRDHEDVAMLAWMRIERVLNLVEDEEYEPGDREQVEAAFAGAGIEERRTSFTDYGRLPAAELERAVGEVLEWLEQGHRVYLHCRAGWQRSAAVAAGVVAIREGLEIDDALELVRQRKPSADPLPAQRNDLRRWWAQRQRGGPPSPVPPSGIDAAGEAGADDLNEPGQGTAGATDWTQALEAIKAVTAAPATPAAPASPTTDPAIEASETAEGEG